MENESRPLISPGFVLFAILVGAFFLRPFAPLEGTWTFGETVLAIGLTVVMGCITHAISITVFPDPLIKKDETRLFDYPPGVVFVTICIIVPLWEEFIFRFLVVGAMYQFGLFWALVWSGVLFGIVHRHYKFAKILKGSAYAGIYIMSGTLWAPILAHALWNFLVMLFAKRLKDRDLFED